MARPRTPTKILELKNSFQKNPNRRRPLEPQVDPAIPEPPGHLSPIALVEWNRVCEILYSVGIITSIDRGILAAYCQVYARWVEAEEDVLKNGMLVESGERMVKNIHLQIANESMRDLHRYASELGMTPSSRSRVTAKPPGEKKTKWQK